MKKEENEIVSLDTMACVGQKLKLAGREYTVCPVNIKDMHFIINSGELYIPIDKKEEKDDIALQLVGINVTDEEKSKNLFYIIKKYVRYNEMPVTKELVEEHNWSFKDIKEFLTFWAQIVSD